ncbi:MAG: glutathione S-transferase [Halioglobus sp.]|jgi:glutathione S-transferase
MPNTCTLYAITHSLYSGRARSYLIKNAIPFRELSTGHESFKADILPKANLATIPTLLTPEGEVIRDGAAIIEHFEAGRGRPSRPPGARQQIVSALFDVIGTDGLLRPAMHYRWNFPKENLDFLRYHFLYSQRDVPQREEKTQHMMDRMRHVGQVFGVTQGTTALVESQYMKYLAALNAHFEEYPYLLGWQPCIGDFGLIAPMYAHLGRDPYPARLMQRCAVRVYRWVERMNRADHDTPEYFNAGEGFLGEDQVPDTLLAVLRVLAEDFVPETRAAADCINHWLAEKPPETGTSAVLRLGDAIGMAQFSVQGQSVSALAQAHRFYLLQRVHAVYDALDADGKDNVEKMLAECGMAELLTTRLDRQLGRADNLEVWL